MCLEENVRTGKRQRWIVMKAWGVNETEWRWGGHCEGRGSDRVWRQVR